MTKYSIKNICLGIGIGLIIASIANISTGSGSLSEEDIRREAAKRNLIVIDAKDIIQKQPVENIEKQEPDETEKDESLQESPVIEIKSGASSESVAELLLTNKLIDSKEAFLNRLAETGKQSRLQIGRFNIPNNASLDEIIEIITSTPR